MADKLAEKVPNGVERFLLPNLETKVQLIVQKEIDRVMKLEEEIRSIDKRLSLIENNLFLVASNNLSIRYP